MKPIRLSGHACDNMVCRGATEREVVEAITTSAWEPAREGRSECRKDFAFGAIWNGKFCETKQVRPIFIDEADETVVITVYVYYF